MIQFTLTALLIQLITVAFPDMTVEIPSASQLSNLSEDDVVPPRIVPLPASNDDDDIVPPRMLPLPHSNHDDDIVPPR
jgi:hypothetical protein